MSWHWLVTGDGDQLMPAGCCGVGGEFCRPLIAPVCGSVNSRGLLTTAASCGAASGTRMTSIRHSEVAGSVAAVLAQPASSWPERTLAVPET